MRQRKNHTEMAATHIRMMQKAMEQMNIKLQNVIADITGKSGQRIIAAILQGERRPEVLIQLLDGRIKASREEVCKSLKGIWKEENLFELRQSFEIYQIYRNKVQECDEKIKIHLETKTEEIKTDAAGATKTKVKSNKNNLSFDATEILAQIIGTDVTKIYGITDTNAIEIISEIGLDMNKWPTARHFTAWLNLAPNNKVSGGKVLSSRIQKKKNRAGQIFKMAAFAVQRSKNWLAIFYHRLKSKRGTAKALVATARKIAIIFYKLLKEKISFNPLSEEEYMETFKQQKLRRLKKQAALLGLSLVPNDLVT